MIIRGVTDKLCRKIARSGTLDKNVHAARLLYFEISVIEGLTESASASAETLRRQLAELQRTTGELRTNLTAQLDTALARHADSQATVEKLTREHEKTVAHYQDSIQDKEKLIQAQKARENELTEQLKALARQTKELEGQRADAASESEAAQRELQAQIETNEKNIQIMRERIAQAEKEKNDALATKATLVEELKRKQTAHNQEILRLERSIQIIKRQNELLPQISSALESGDTDKAKRIAGDIHSGISTQLQQILDQKDQLAGLRKHLEEERSAATQLSESLIQRIESLEKEYSGLLTEDLEVDRGHLREKQELSARVYRIAIALERMGTANKALSSQIEAMQRENESQIRDLNVRIRQLEQEKQQLDANLQREKEAKQAAIDTLKAERAAIELARQTADSGLANIQEQLSASQASAKKVNTTLGQVRSVLKETRRLLKRTVVGPTITLGLLGLTLGSLLAASFKAPETADQTLVTANRYLLTLGGAALGAASGAVAGGVTRLYNWITFPPLDDDDYMDNNDDGGGDGGGS